MKVQKIKLNSCDATWIVLDDNHLPIKPITEFVRYLNVVHDGLLDNDDVEHAAYNTFIDFRYSQANNQLISR